MIRIDIQRPAGILSMQEAAAKLGVSRQRIHYLLKRGRVAGAEQIGATGTWIIPHDFVITPACAGRPRKKPN